PYADQQCMLDASDYKGNNQYWKTEYISALTPEYCDAFRDAALRLTSPLSYSVIFHIGGALNERPGDDGAVGNRDAQFVTGFSGVWPPEDPRTDQHVAWVRRSWEAIRPYSTGGNYVNFQLADDDEGRTAAAYGANYERLRRVKAAYDPDNVFRMNRNIGPGR
ncbi:MAG TPA: BBE domain-containing protein, partial [Longimicrobiales bacterium]